MRLGLIYVVLLVVWPIFAQTVGLRGQISDSTGALVPGAKVTLSNASGVVRTLTSNDSGAYSFSAIAPGDYAIQATAPDLTLPQPVKISLRSGIQTLDLQLMVVVTGQQVTVRENAAPAVSTDAASNASALVLTGNDLQSLADDPDDLASDLQALAGPAAGPNGGALYVDGFSGGELPSKDSIREIRINQNPFSPEYDKLGYGRVEVFTKPGTDRFKGSAFYNFGDSVWNSRDPFAQRKAPFELKEYGGNLSGPLGSRASFFLDIQRHAIDNGDIIHAIIVDPATLAIVNPFTQVFRTPQRRIIVSPRIDYQLNSNNTLSIRYRISRPEIRDANIGNLNLVSSGDLVRNLHQTVQATETAVLGAGVINETRFQYYRFGGSTYANNPDIAIQVVGAFVGGGSQAGHSFDTENDYEAQNYTSVARGSHTWRFGVRLRGETIDDTSQQNFGGTFVFDSIELYQRSLQLGLNGGGATQFKISVGHPAISVGQADFGASVGDDWRVRPNLTLNLGLRYEGQTNIRDRRDFAPRVGLAWAPAAGSGKGAPKSVIRAGFGIFYDRFDIRNTLTAERFNGVVQRQLVITNPDFSFSTIPQTFGVSSTTQEKSATLRAPYVMQSAVSLERQLPFHTTVALTYANSHGLHQLRSEDINAPLPGSGAFPYPLMGPIFLMESSGLYNQNQLITNVNSHVNSKISLFGYYVYNRAMSNTDGLNTFPAKPYSFAGEYGPAGTDIHHRVSAGGSIDLRWNIRISPLFTAASGPPFDITTGSDIYGDTLFNGRPGIAPAPNKSGVIDTKYGLLDPNPTPDEKILPRNFGRGPGTMMLNVRIGKTFTFGSMREGAGTSAGGGGDRRTTPGVFGTGGGPGASTISGNRRYNLTFLAAFRNVLNHTNPGPIIGDITSQLFGMANQTAGASSLGGTNFLENANNRRLELQARFTF
jgi:hypothetical protein